MGEAHILITGQIGEIIEMPIVANFLEGMATELAAITLACGKQDVHELNRTDLVALTPQAAAITGSLDDVAAVISTESTP